MISANNVTLRIGKKALFEDVNIKFTEGNCYGLIGANGAGKSTFLKILTGQIEPSKGDVSITPGQRLSFLEQDHFKYDEYTALDTVIMGNERLYEIMKEKEAIYAKEDFTEEDGNKASELEAEFADMNGWEAESDAAQLLNGLGITTDLHYKQMAELNGSEKVKVLLAKALFGNPDILLLDEPTNHLDLDAIAWLEEFLINFENTVIVVSHDRYFLDNVTNKTIELEHNRAMVYKGSYSEFVKKKESVNESLKNKYEHDLKEIKRIEGIVEQQKRWGQAHNFITAASKQKEADRIKDGLVAPESELETMRMHFEPRCESGNDVLICKNLAKSFDNKQLFKNVDIHIRKGERVFIIGGNGCGKTTLFRILTGKTPMNSGEYDYGANVEIGYFDQMQQNLDLSKTALDEVWDTFPNMTQTEVRSALASFLFKGDEVFKPLSKMSGGERARVSLLKLMLKGSNFLLLDEPTNHLDASSREELEKTLLDYSGTMLIVSHDRYFINKIADRILLLTNNGVKEYLGNYDYYLERTTAEKSGAVPTENKKDKKEKTQNDYFLQKQKQSEERKRQTKLKKAEAEIERLDEEIAKTQELLSSEEVAADYEKLMELSKLLEDLQKQQEEQYEIWEELESMAE